MAGFGLVRTGAGARRVGVAGARASRPPGPAKAIAKTAVSTGAGADDEWEEF